MTEQKVICDRCGSIVLEERSLLTPQTGIVRTRYHAVDLCLDCSRAFLGWLASGHLPELPADLEPPPSWPPSAGRSATPRDLGIGVAP